MRYWVYRALYEVIVHQVYSNLYLKNNLYQVDCKDQALATNIFYGTIQNYSFCQYVWKQYAHYKVSDKIDVLLSMSVYQLIFLDKVPSYAIVNEAIEIAKKEEPRSKGFVNAILRKINKNKINYPENEFNRLSIQYSLPVWLLKMWDKQYGSMQMRNMLPYCNQIMPLYIRYNPNYTFETTYEHICGTLYKTNLNQIAKRNQI